MHATPMDVGAARRRAEDRDWRPRNCVWEVTLACNLRCAHCGSRAGTARPDELSTDECLDVVAQLDELGCELVTLSGGEPTLRDDWDRIAAAVSARGMKVNLVTNGVYRSPEVADEIARRARDAGLSNVGVSVDGPAAVHDRIRGVGTFARVVESIRRFQANGVSVGVMTTVSALNVDHLGSVRQIAIDAGASLWRLQLGKPMGNLSDRADWVLPPHRLLDVVPRLARWKKEGGIHLAVGDSIGYYGPADRTLRGWGWRGRREAWRGCQAGMRAIGIEADGGVKGCLSLQAKDGDRDPFVEGNVRQTKLTDLWFQPGVFAYNRDFTRDLLGGFCAHCKHADACRGGARCVTSALGDSLWDDPYCVQRQLAEVQTASGRAGGRASVAAAAAALLLTLGSRPCQVIPVDPGPDAGSTSDTVDCTNVCCECEYGILPDDIWRACCEVPPDPCADVCCECDYGIIPEELWTECCVPPPDPCANACCDCDYGEPPPPECCP